MSYPLTLNVAVIAFFLPTTGIGQTLAVSLYWKSAVVRPAAGIPCPKGAEGFEIKGNEIDASLEAGSAFTKAVSVRPRIRKGTIVENGNKHFRPAVRSVESESFYIDTMNGRAGVEGRDTVYAKAEISLSGCRRGLDFELKEGHLRLNGKVEKYRINIDSSLGDLVAPNAIDDAITIAARSVLTSVPEGPLGNLIYKLEQIELKGLEAVVGIMAFSINVRNWSIPYSQNGFPSLEADINITGSATLVVKPE